MSIPSLTEKDLSDLHFALTAGVDIIALSFVRTAGDVQQLRDRLGGRPDPVVAKIEKPEGWENIEPILAVTDGVMVARGDLGVEMALEKVPRIQKSIIRAGEAQRPLRHHRHPDARIDDRQPRAHPRGSQRCRQRHL